MNEYVAIIQTGGKGTRMHELTKDLIPKPLLELNGKPMMQWQMEPLIEYGINEFIFFIGHLGEKIKLKIGMLLKAAEKYNIDLSQSWYVGDTTIDIQTGINAGMKTVLVKTGEAGKDGQYPVQADY